MFIIYQVFLFFFLVNFGTLTYESGPGYLEDFPYTDDPVYVLGESYSAKYGVLLHIDALNLVSVMNKMHATH